jgi:hypothetical protein
LVQLAAMGRNERTMKLLDDTALVRRVFRILVDRAWFVEVTPTRAFDAFADFDSVGEHALDTIDPRNQVARSGWVGSHQ